MTDFSDRVKSQLFSFKKHPFAFYFSISWISLNWKALIYLFSDMSADEKIEKIIKIHDPLSIFIFDIFTITIPPFFLFWNLLLPIIGATVIVFIFNPIVAKKFYKKQLDTDFVFKDIKRTIESEERLTKEESIKLKIELYEQSNKYIYIATQNESLKIQLNAKELEINNAVKNAKIEISNIKDSEISDYKNKISSKDSEIENLRYENKNLKTELKIAEQKYEETVNDLNKYNQISEKLKSFIIKYELTNQIKKEAYIKDFIEYASEYRFIINKNIYEQDKFYKRWSEKIQAFEENGLVEKTGKIQIMGEVIYSLKNKLQQKETKIYFDAKVTENPIILAD